MAQSSRSLRAAAALGGVSFVVACSGEFAGPAAGELPSETGVAPPPGGAAPGQTQCLPTRRSFAPARLWQISDRQYVNVVKSVFDITLSDEEGKIVSSARADRFTQYSEGTVIDTQAAANFQTVAATVADLALGRMADLFGTVPPSRGQIEVFIRNKIARAWRRPVEGSEVAALLK